MVCRVPRPPRIQPPGGVFHLTSRGNKRQVIFRVREDHLLFLRLLDLVAARFGWHGHAYCLLPNHYHLVVETPKANLSRGVQWLNGCYAQAFNMEHGLAGHVFQGRFHSILVESDHHLLELSRYLALNPVRAGLCRHPRSWPWSSYRGVAGLEPPRSFLTPGRVLELFGGRDAAARERFVRFVEAAPIRFTDLTVPAMPGVRPRTWPR
jgi:putative transposase